MRDPGSTPESLPRRIGKIEVFGAFAHGGMASVHVGRIRGPAGFAKLVAVKQVSAKLADSERHARMLLEEARLSARIRSPYVVTILDVVHESDALCIVMDLVRGVSLSELLGHVIARGGHVEPSIASAILVDALRGLHAAHEATDVNGRPLQIIHRDVSPHNLIVGADGVTRVLDFGVAKGKGSEALTHTGEVKGKVGYMPPEQLAGHVTRQSDLYAAGVVLWEALVGARLRKDDVANALHEIMLTAVPSPRSKNPALSPELDAVVMKAVATEPARRFANAEAMAIALEEACPPASPDQVGRFVEEHGFASLEALDEVTRDCESRAESPSHTPPPPLDGEAPGPRTELGFAAPAGVPAKESHRLGAPLIIGGLLLAALSAMGAHVWFGGGAVTAIPEARADAQPDLEVGGPGERADLAPATLATASPAVSAPPSDVVLNAPLVEPQPQPPRQPPATAQARSAPTPPVSGPRARPSSAPHRTSNAACTPPYEYDARGRKHYKRECLP